MPVYNDWPLIPPLLARLDAALAGAGLGAEVVLADDGSTDDAGPDLLQGARYQAITSVTLLHLGRNVGHQRALAIGLAYVHAHRECRAVVIMDADGEDAAGGRAAPGRRARRPSPGRSSSPAAPRAPRARSSARSTRSTAWRTGCSPDGGSGSATSASCPRASCRGWSSSRSSGTTIRPPSSRPGSPSRRFRCRAGLASAAARR